MCVWRGGGVNFTMIIILWAGGKFSLNCWCSHIGPPSLNSSLTLPIVFLPALNYLPTPSRITERRNLKSLATNQIHRPITLWDTMMTPPPRHAPCLSLPAMLTSPKNLKELWGNWQFLLSLPPGRLLIYQTAVWRKWAEFRWIVTERRNSRWLS